PAASTAAAVHVLSDPRHDALDGYFPGPGTMAALRLDLREGATAEAAMIGQEGAVGGVVSDGRKPAFTRGVVQFAGAAMRLSTDARESPKPRSPGLRHPLA